MKLSSVYEPHQFEEEINALWEKTNAFTPPEGAGDDYFSLVLPPVNANGNLHIGHALTVAIEDVLARYWRLRGAPALYIPGADHAGFETQVVYEKMLASDGKSRFDFSRDELYKQIWDFVEKNKHNVQTQIRSLGASVDWTRFTYTLDDNVIETTYQTFEKMWEEGLIYRGKRIVNYCTFHGTSFSDIEVVHEEEETKLWHIAYPLKEGSGEVVIATTRPETKLGQAALMVHPDDERYKNLVGKEVLQPLVADKPIKIIADKYVDKEFGTGVVTVTPAHDPNDFEVAQRHNLEPTELITIEGKMSDQVPEDFRGLSIQQARQKAERALKEQGYLRKVEDHVHSVGKCYKCGTVIEPLLREQWFVKMRPLADRAIEILEQDKITFYPKSKLNQTIRYLKEVKDWNISRQIAWGIPIPAFQNVEDPSDWIFDTRIQEEQVEFEGKQYNRDPDVFDTWFSSSQWPFVTLGFSNSPDFKTYYPLSLMETGGEILYQWVARMIVMGIYTTGKVPFKDVYIHGYVLAEDGQKMSKSLGNVIDPLEIIGEYGSDALRMGLLAGRRAGVNQGYHPAKIVGGRNFANKIWNISRYIEDKVDNKHTLRSNPSPVTRADHWILQQFSRSNNDIAKSLENYRLSEAYEFLYGFLWGDLADWYIEASKTSPNQPLLAYLLDGCLKIAHPFAPFLTETIWQTLSWEEGTVLATQRWPGLPQYDEKLAREFDEIKSVASEARSMMKNLGIGRPTLYFKDSSLIQEESKLLMALAGLSEIKEMNGQARGLKLTNTAYNLSLEVEEDKLAAYQKSLEEKEKFRLQRVKNLSDRLGSTDYVNKAPKALVEETKKQLTEETGLLRAVQQELENLRSSLKS